MLRRFLAIVLTAILALPSLAQDKGASPLPPTAEELQKQIDALRTRLGTLEGKIKQQATEIAELQSLRMEVAGLRDQLEQATRDNLAGLSQVSGKLNALLKSVDALKVEAKKPAMASKLRIVNIYPYTPDVMVIINGLMYRVQYGETKDFEVPTGTVNFQVLGVHGVMQSRLIREGDILQVQVRSSQ